MLGSGEDQCKKILEKNHFETIRKLGKGGQGHVLLTSKFVQTVNFYAVKCISLKKCAKNPEIKRYINQQTQTMCALDHPHIVRLQNSFADSGWHFLVMEYCDMGNLMQYQSRGSQKSLGFNEAVKFLYQIMKGVKAIHSYNIIHRDLKCQNIFLKKKKKEGGYICKIGDFGFAKVIDEKTKTNCGTVLYMAPEIMSKHPYDQKVDIWSLGVIFHYMIFGEYPFKCNISLYQALNIEKQIQDKCGQGFKIFEHQKLDLKDKKLEFIIEDFFSRVFNVNQNQRISLSDMFEHPLFNNSEIEVASDSTTDDQVELDIEWEMEKVKFIKNCVLKLSEQKVLPENLEYAASFYLFKASNMFLHQTFLEKYLKEQPQTKTANFLRELMIETENNLKLYYRMLSNFSDYLKSIPKFNDGFNMKVQDFTQMKQGYRNTIGKVYEEIHKKISDERRQAQLKFQIFCCHLINRVFSKSSKEQIFPKYRQWLQKNKLEDKKSYRGVDFLTFREWIECENPENLLVSIEILNKTFYKKE